MKTKICLGSQSKYRRLLIQRLGFDVVCINPDADESSISAEKVEDLVILIANLKADVLLKKLTAEQKQGLRYLVCGDIVTVDENDTPLGKPRNETQAREWICGYRESLLSGTVQAITVVDLLTGQHVSGTDRTVIKFEPGHFTEAEVEEYLKDDSYMFASGAMLIEHSMFRRATASIDGSIDSIQGLSLDLLRGLLRELGWQDEEAEMPVQSAPSLGSAGSP